MKKSNSENYTIEALPTDKSKIPQIKASDDQILPRFPFSMMISGRSGGGKTNLMLNLLTKKNMFKDYFQHIIVFSPTAGQFDDTYKILKLHKDNFIRDLNEIQLDQIIKLRQKQIKMKGIEYVAKNSRMLLILDDVIANRDFLESPGALKMFALLRHYLVSVIIMIQSYTKLPRALRLNCNAVMTFPALSSEVETLKDEITPSGLTKKEFGKVIEYCTQGKYDFLYINNHADPDKRIRKNLDEIIDLNKYKS
jgi:hypothetical protein